MNVENDGVGSNNAGDTQLIYMSLTPQPAYDWKRRDATIQFGGSLELWASPPPP